MTLKHFILLGCFSALSGCQLLPEIVPDYFGGLPSQASSSEEWASLGEAESWAPPITSLAFSPDGKRLVVGNRPRLQGYFDNTRSSYIGKAHAVYSLWHQASDSLSDSVYQRCGFVVPDGALADITMSTDTNAAMFAATHEKGVDFRDANDGSLKKHLDVPDESVWGWGLVSPDCRFVVWSRNVSEEIDTSAILIQDVNSESIIATFPQPGSGVRAKAFSQDGRMLAARSLG